MPKISIITAAYIDSKGKSIWLQEMIQSVIVQTFQDWELVIVDDKSPIRVGAPYISIDDLRIRLIHQVDNNGPAMTRNTAVNQAASNCLLPLDSDDKLAHPGVLEAMYDAWSMDQSKVIYGNLQVLKGDTLNDIMDLGVYSFENSMGLKGTMPVTCMHSLECHQRLGGWKSELKYGREDVEYWLNAGKLGFCGYNIGLATLIYRMHEESRDYRLKYVNGKQSETEKQIRQIHSDLYEGRFPMGCCGDKDGGSNNNSVIQQNIQTFDFSNLGVLPDVPEDEKMWVQYAGPKKAKFAIRGMTSNYEIFGTGYPFEIHKRDWQRLRIMERGQGFLEMATPPSVDPPQEETALVETHVEVWPEIEVSQIERMDDVALAKFGLQPETVEIPMPIMPVANKEYSLNDLELGRHESILENDDWTVESIAMTEPEELMAYHGIGPVRARDIIAKANELIK